ncbi:phosphoribosylaminoimidazole carboxylase [Bifidobacterium dolichotidis]|uniref:N5-carboxyaminoimidazole ribonucleotide synthase n=1 Tax=Bifidobacterium dolichotidis TaxID=2306976 RepID=A0A430FPQ9_9BIFI|nr:5-(carboxyamino)imidazole ribonucleotide synthase [Bifidobacterium dolichotidis]RSX54819.1 phosphoribosylaminoimidazole carboxylase [Bifidobacterium dolichotidis]
MPSLSELTQGTIQSLRPPAVIGIVGGGQLGRMMALSAKYMGFRIAVLDPTPDCPTAQVADLHIQADYDDADALQALAEHSDVLTYEFENVDAATLDAVSDIVAVPQGTELLRVTQNRIAEKTFINEHGIETAHWRPVESRDELEQALRELGYPAVLKTAEGGYDGHGQIVLKRDKDLELVWPDEEFPPSILESFVDFAFEASILVCGNGSGYVTFPLVRNIHRNNILHMTVAPAQVDAVLAERARDLALCLAEGFSLAGILAIELFVTHDGRLIVNELAPRPHNSGHYTIEACSFDQFDLHIRGIAGLPLPEPQLLSPAVMVNVLGQHVESVQERALQEPQWHVHDYGKAQAKVNRKMGHVTVLCKKPDEMVRMLEYLGIWH